MSARRIEKCPQCGANITQTNLGGGKTDDYCEECGWPDENRPVHPSGLTGEHDVVLDAIYKESLHGL